MNFLKSIIHIFFRWWCLIAVVTLLVSLFCSATAKWMGWIELEYESVALVEVKSIVDVDSSSEGGHVGLPITRRFTNHSFGPEYTSMLAPLTIEVALQKYNLEQRLGGDMKKAQLRMKRILKVGYYRHYDLIEVKACCSDPVLARDVVVAICEAYKERRLNLEMAMRKSQLKAVKAEILNRKSRLLKSAEELREGSLKLSQVREGSLEYERIKLNVKDVSKRMTRDQKILDVIQQKYDYESTKLGYDPWFLIIHKEAQIPTAPNYKSLVVVTLLASPLALIMSVLLAYFADSRFPRVAKVSE